jgi:hypothetical protein
MTKAMTSLAQHQEVDGSNDSDSKTLKPALR